MKALLRFGAISKGFLKFGKDENSEGEEFSNGFLFSWLDQGTGMMYFVSQTRGVSHSQAQGQLPVEMDMLVVEATEVKTGKKVTHQWLEINKHYRNFAAVVAEAARLTYLHEPEALFSELGLRWAKKRQEHFEWYQARNRLEEYWEQVEIEDRRFDKPFITPGHVTLELGWNAAERNAAD